MQQTGFAVNYRVIIFTFFVFISTSRGIAQPGYWQQRVNYSMDVKLDVQSNIITGKQTITYTNNSPDTLKELFFHLFYNAFHKGSMMDDYTRSTENLVIGNDAKGNDITDFDKRFKYRISDMTEDEEGYSHILSMTIDGRKVAYTEHETILKANLDKPLLPRQTITIKTEFKNKVPKLSRRSGRDNPEGIRYSLGQWYPKLSEYDETGWHADDYIAREFYGPWGNFDVNITLDKNYKLGGTGILQNASEIGWGYDKAGSSLKPVNGTERTWKFRAENVHDFMWAADPGYLHYSKKVPGGPLLHFIFKDIDSLQNKKWMEMADSTVIAYPYMAKTFGAYPYPAYTFIQGGGGGTEYPMATLLRGAGLNGAIHEWMHSWFQMMLATNENLYSWMDEGFTEYAEQRVLGWLKKDTSFVQKACYNAYFRFAKTAFVEPMNTHANFYATNFAYNYNAYYKGAVFIEQLGYITGAETRDKILLQYYKQWRFKHPDPDKFIKLAEEVSGMQLKWYKEYFVNTTKTIDYKIDSLWSDGEKTFVRIKRAGEMPMPLDIRISFKDNTQEIHYVPLNLMYGEKEAEDALPRTIYPAQPFTNRDIIISTNKHINEITAVEIDPSKRMADIDRKNNRLDLKW
jgi:hypothetical protein